MTIPPWITAPYHFLHENLPEQITSHDFFLPLNKLPPEFPLDNYPPNKF